MCSSDLGLALLKAGTDLSDLSAREILKLDAKTKEDFDTIITIAQVNTADIDDVLQREEELKKAINDEIKENSLDLFILLITDIVNANSMAIIMGDKSDVAEDAFNNKVEEDKMFLEGVISRKKQVIPPIEEVLRNN